MGYLAVQDDLLVSVALGTDDVRNVAKLRGFACTRQGLPGRRQDGRLRAHAWRTTRRHAHMYGDYTSCTHAHAEAFATSMQVRGTTK